MSKMIWWAATAVVVLSATTLTGCFATRAGYETAPYADEWRKALREAIA